MTFKQILDLATKLSWETQAQILIKEKIAHFKKSGNIRKLKIYKAKQSQKVNIIGKVKDLLEKANEQSKET